MVESDESGFVGVEAAEQCFHLFAIRGVGSPVRRHHVGPTVPRLRGTRRARTSGISQSSGDDPTGDHRQVGGEARSARKCPEGGGLVSQALDENVGDKVVAIGRREREPTLPSGFRGDEGE